MRDAFDVVVVGAGPAGSITALELARRGRRVLLLDRHAFPRAKPCGDCLSPEVTRLLDQLGVLAPVESLRPARLDGWRIHSPDGAGFTGAFERAAAGDARVRSALAITRARLDATLVSAACVAGAELRAPARVEDLCFDGDAIVGVIVRQADGRRSSIRARLVVGADGLRSIVARRAGATRPPGRLRKHSLTIHPRLPADFTRGFGEMHVVEHGCIGIAPVEEGDCPVHNVTFVTLSHARAGDPRDVMRAMLDGAPALRGRRAALLDAIARSERPLASGPFDRPVRFTVRDGLALVGDAAGYYDPFTGQGVCRAIAGATRLASVADAALDGAATLRATQLRSYARWLRRARAPSHGVQRIVENVAARPKLMNAFARAIDGAPRFADALVAVTGDIAPVRSLAGRPILSLGAAAARTATRSFM